MMSERHPTYGDNPIHAAGDDWLGRAAPAEALASLIMRELIDLPLTVGVYGDWGSGKTSLLQLVRSQLDGRHLVFWFNAWAYAQQHDALWRALLLALIEAFRNPASQMRLLDDQTLGKLLADELAKRASQEAELNTRLDRLETSLYRAQSYATHEGYNVNWQAAAMLAVRQLLRLAAPGSEDLLKAMVAQLASGADVKDLFEVLQKREREELREHVQSIEQFRREFHTLIEDYVNRNQRRLVIFIDDLDRCLPEAAVGVLEAIKIFFVPDDGKPLDVVFVLGMDRRIVEQGIKVRYANFALAERPAMPLDAGEYLDKIVQVPFGVPPLSNNQIEQFAWRWCATHQQALQSCGRLIAEGVAPNPRSVKRTLHTLSLTLDTRTRAGLKTPPERLGLLAKLVVLQTSYEPVFRALVRSPRLIHELERASKAEPPPEGEAASMLADYPRLRVMLTCDPLFPVNPAEAERQINDLLYYHG